MKTASSLSQHPLQRLIQKHKAGWPIGITSICSAHPWVIEAAMLHALCGDGLLLIEATCNQVNQEGGYTGITPSGFADFVYEIAARTGFPAERLLLGGDHLGPNPWKSEPAEVAMEKACRMVEAYVAAGFTKIHLDASMRCQGDPGEKHAPLPDAVAAERAAQLCEAAERAWKSTETAIHAPVYIIGTEVPIPGGAHADEGALQITTPVSVEQTLAISRSMFQARDLEDAWERVIGIVVQPGVEFGDDSVVEYDSAKAAGLARAIESNTQIIYEAHSTDYQTPQALAQLVRDHFAILKVGPQLTFAVREALIGLEHIEQATLGRDPEVQLSGFRTVLDTVMLHDPRHWADYYAGNAARQAFARTFSYSDRCRYYGRHAMLIDSTRRLIENLNRASIPHTLLSQYLPTQYWAVREGRLRNQPEAIVMDKVTEVLQIYAQACHSA